MFQDSSAPARSAVRPCATVVPPEDPGGDGRAANLRGLHASPPLDDAARTDSAHSAVQRINDMMIARHNALAPPEQGAEP